MAIQERTETDNTIKFSKLFSELEHCNEDEQKQKILEVNEIIDKMDREEFISVFSEKLFSEINTMIEEKKLFWGNAILLLKHVGFWNILKAIWICGFEKSSLIKGFEKMIIEEEKKKEEKDENYLVDLCKCYLMHLSLQPSELFSICVPCLLKFALKKEESKETQKEVEITLLALSNIDNYKIEKELYLNEIKEIIQYHQEHHNLTQLAYQSVWEFLINRFFDDHSLEEVIVNEFHFMREATRELEELIKQIDWKRKKEEKGGKETNVQLFSMRWMQVLYFYLLECTLWNEECLGLINSITRLLRVTKDNYRKISRKCICLLKNTARSRAVKVDDLLEGGAIDDILEGIQEPTLNDEMVFHSLDFFTNIFERLKKEENDEMEEDEDEIEEEDYEKEEKEDDESEKMKRKEAKRKVLEKIEEEGYEDTITSFHENLDFLCNEFYPLLSLNVSDYFVKI